MSHPRFALLAGHGGVGQVVRFVVTGCLGFLVDAVVLLALEPRLGPVASQGVAYAAALVVTFALNRLWTFQAGQAPLASQGARYIAVTVAGALAINGIYGLATWLGAPSLAALSIAAVGWAMLSYGLMMRLVFFRRPHVDQQY